MRCQACNVILNDYELRIKDSHGNHVDLCNKCIKFMDDDYKSRLVFPKINSTLLKKNYLDDPVEEFEDD